MKKNKMMRLAAVLLVLTLLSTCFTSGTYAKYVTSDKGTDTARVAKWGVTVTATGDNFKDVYANDDSTTTITNTVVASNYSSGSTGDKLVAPGTSGDLVSFSISGTPEVAVKVSYEATLTFSNWEISEDSSNITYCPIIITIGNFNYMMGNSLSSPEKNATLGNYVYTTTDEFSAGVKTAIENYSKEYAANTKLNDQTADALKISWKWEFEGDATEATLKNYQTDTRDTALGNLETAPTIELEVTATVTQID